MADVLLLLPDTATGTRQELFPKRIEKLLIPVARGVPLPESLMFCKPVSAIMPSERK